MRDAIQPFSSLISNIFGNLGAERVNEFETSGVKVWCRIVSVAGVGIGIGGLIQTAAGWGGCFGRA